MPRPTAAVDYALLPDGVTAMALRFLFSFFSSFSFGCYVFYLLFLLLLDCVIGAGGGATSVVARRSWWRWLGEGRPCIGGGRRGKRGTQECWLGAVLSCPEGLNCNGCKISRRKM
ncbi:hypothetical protein E1A91_D12G089800v1 [Gossypium mustelinum]|uniref:Uncharacterized protein n=1 Tax=Gossypium mustelinum TaxID=34275 RepID=A0A5D2SBS9_GOSMU|nr:hypothetical protein E1A91_D12G089800v1 [Gossypium mustelinum]